MSKQDLAHFHEFRTSDLKAVLRLIYHTIDVSYSPVYPVRAIQFFKDFHSEAKIIETELRQLPLFFGGSARPTY
jgi:hypothetical protein